MATVAVAALFPSTAFSFLKVSRNHFACSFAAAAAAAAMKAAKHVMTAGYLDEGEKKKNN